MYSAFYVVPAVHIIPGILGTTNLYIHTAHNILYYWSLHCFLRIRYYTDCTTLYILDCAYYSTHRGVLLLNVLCIVYFTYSTHFTLRLSYLNHTKLHGVNSFCACCTSDTLKISLGIVEYTVVCMLHYTYSTYSYFTFTHQYCLIPALCAVHYTDYAMDTTLHILYAL